MVKKKTSLFFLLTVVMSHRLVSFTGATRKIYIFCVCKPTTSIINNKKPFRLPRKAFLHSFQCVAFFSCGLKGYKSLLILQFLIFKEYSLLSGCFDIIFIFICDNHAYFRLAWKFLKVPGGVHKLCQIWAGLRLGRNLWWNIGQFCDVESSKVLKDLIAFKDRKSSMYFISVF